ncbi:zinc-dependent alcohol dehydrogenase family protein [Geminicoccus sp.]|uniref:zinc-dependent alcohol dehydrogenase family protein n=1 Tax=Geminicoccus sp. TaxID=2024832 RepID=UPI0032C2244D
MQAAVLETENGPFHLRQVRRPVPGPGQVLVRIAASGVNPLDAKIRAGTTPHAGHRLPAILGIDLAGTVEAAGQGAAAWKPGDEVYGMTGGVGGIQGSLAEYAAVDADLLARKPVNLTMREAASLPLAFITAWEGLVDRARIQRGQRVLVQGGAGGVGQMAIQLARAMGAQVFATGSAGQAARIERLDAVALDRAVPMADHVAAHTGGQGFDLVYDTVGGPALDAAFEAVRRFGHVVSALGWGTHRLAPLSFRAASYSGVFTLLPLLTGEGRAHHGKILHEATRLVEEGKLVPSLDPRRFCLDHVADAHAALTSRDASGKLVVDIAA